MQTNKTMLQVLPKGKRPFDMGKTANQQEDKTQGEEAVEQGQAISKEEPREDKVKKFSSFRPRYYRSGRGSTAPRYYRTYYRNYYREEQRKYGSDYGSSRGTAAPITVLPCCLCAETGLRPLYPSLDPLRL